MNKKLLIICLIGVLVVIGACIALFQTTNVDLNNAPMNFTDSLVSSVDISKNATINNSNNKIKSDYQKGYDEGYEWAYDGGKRPVNIYDKSEEFVRGYYDGYSAGFDARFHDHPPKEVIYSNENWNIHTTKYSQCHRLNADHDAPYNINFKEWTSTGQTKVLSNGYVYKEYIALYELSSNCPTCGKSWVNVGQENLINSPVYKYVLSNSNDYD